MIRAVRILLRLAGRRRGTFLQHWDMCYQKRTPAPIFREGINFYGSGHQVGTLIFWDSPLYLLKYWVLEKGEKAPKNAKKSEVEGSRVP